MNPEDVESRLQAVLEQLAARRDEAKKALDEAWAQDPQSCASLLREAGEAHERYLSFQEVSRKALPLMQSLARIQRLRQEAVEQLDRLSSQAEETQRQREQLAQEALQTIETIPPMVGERFELTGLSSQQLERIREARAALGAGAGPPASAAEPPQSSPTRDLTLDELEASVRAQEPEPEPQAPPPEAEGESSPVGLPGDDELDAMFEEAVTSESEAAHADAVGPPGSSAPGEAPAAPAEEAAAAPPASPPTPETEPEAEPEPPAPAPVAEEAPTAPPAAPSEARKDPLDELLTRAGFDG